MTWAAVGSIAAATSASLSLNPQNTGDLILAEVILPTTTSITPTSISGGGATWTLIASYTGSVNTANAAVFAGTVTATGSATATISFTGGSPGTIRCVAQEFSTTQGGWTLDVSGHIDSAGTSQFPVLTPAVSGELYFGYAYDSGTGSSGSTGGYTYGQDPNGNTWLYNPGCTSSAQAPSTADSGNQDGLAVLMRENPWKWVQSCSGSGASVSSVSATFGSNVTAGNKYVCSVVSNTATMTSVKNGAGASLTQLGAAPNTTDGVYTYLYAMDIPPGDGGTKPVITATPPSSAFISLVVQEVAGLAAGNTSAMLDGTPGAAHGTGSPTTSPSYTSTAAVEYLVALYGDDGESLAATAPGYTMDPAGVNDATSHNGTDNYVGYKNSAAAGESAVFSPAANWAVLLGAFKLASAAAIPGQPVVVGQAVNRAASY